MESRDSSCAGGHGSVLKWLGGESKSWYCICSWGNTSTCSPPGMRKEAILAIRGKKEKKNRIMWFETELCPPQTELQGRCGQEAQGFLGNAEPFQLCWEAQKRETKAKQVSYSTPLAPAATCTALPAYPPWQKLSAPSYLADGTGSAGRLAVWVWLQMLTGLCARVL